MPTHAEKNRGRRVLFPLKRANISPFGLYDRAAGPAVLSEFGVRVRVAISIAGCRMHGTWNIEHGTWNIMELGTWNATSNNNKQQQLHTPYSIRDTQYSVVGVEGLKAEAEEGEDWV
jgi:hypothetical protein